MKLQLLPSHYLSSNTDLALNRNVKILQNLLGTFASKYHYGSEGDVHAFNFCVSWIRIESLCHVFPPGRMPRLSHLP